MASRKRHHSGRDVLRRVSAMYGLLRPTLRPFCHLILGLDIIWIVLGPRRLLAAGAPIRQVSYQIDMSDPETVTHLSAIIDSLEDLSILDRSHLSCYAVDKIVKTEQRLESGTWKLSISLYVQEIADKVSMSEMESDDNVTSTKACPNLSHGELEGNTLDSLTNHTNNVLPRLYDNNATAIPGATVKEKEGGLSGTQIMVISTCSTVIGLFFLVALGMRIRNYVKRYRAEQQNRRSTFRSAALGLRDSDSENQNSQTPNPPATHLHRFKPHRSSGFKFGTSVGFSYFYAHGGGSGWTPGFSY